MKKTQCEDCKEGREGFHIPLWNEMTYTVVPNWRVSKEANETPLAKAIKKHERQNYISVYCAGIACKHYKKIRLSSAWFGEGTVEDHVFCQDCYDQKQWFDAVCGGCVSGYPNCPFTEVFTYKYNHRRLTKEEKKTILRGHCPFRVNGIEIDISSKATYQQGKAILRGVNTYINYYFEGD